MAGSFGYELDLNTLSEEEKLEVAKQIRTYKEYQPLIHNGLYYRLSNPHKENMAVWEFVSQDRKEVLVQGVVFRAKPNTLRIRIRLAGLEEGMYEVLGTGERYTGKALMTGGILLPKVIGDDVSFEIHLKKK